MKEKRERVCVWWVRVNETERGCLERDKLESRRHRERLSRSFRETGTERRMYVGTCERQRGVVSSETHWNRDVIESGCSREVSYVRLLFR